MNRERMHLRQIPSTSKEMMVGTPWLGQEYLEKSVKEVGDEVGPGINKNMKHAGKVEPKQAGYKIFVLRVKKKSLGKNALPFK